MNPKPHTTAPSAGALRLGMMLLSALALLLAVKLIAGPWRSAHAAEGDNIAPLTPYEITPAPNYDLATGVPSQVLTDGRRASGRFWVSADSIGWYYQSPVIYRQTFAMPRAIQRIEIGTGQYLRSEIGLPANTFVYARGADGLYTYLGDAAAAPEAPADGTRALHLDVPPTEATGIAIVSYRSTPYLVLDEIRILATTAGRKPGPLPAISDIAADAGARRRAYAEARAGIAPIGTTPSTRFAWPINAELADTKGCRTTQISPWTESDAASIAAAPADTRASLNAVGGWLSTAVRIENGSPQPQSVAFEASTAAGTLPAEILVANYGLALDYRWRADILAPVTALVLPPRSTSLVIVRARITEPGDVRTRMTLTCANDRAAVDLVGRAFAVQPDHRPFGNTWSYVKGPSQNLLRCQSTIHSDAWIDTAVIDSPALLPKRTAAMNAELRAYLRVFAGSRRLLLFMDLKDPAWTTDSGPRLAQQLAAWWAVVSKVIADEGYTGEVLFYPIDEATDAQIPRLNAIATILRQIAPQISIFATVGSTAVAENAAIDVKQFHDRMLSKVGPRTPTGRSPQLYATADYVKALGLSDYYRRLPWLAFGAGWQGAGLWSMWDANGADQAAVGWSDFGGIERDFNLVYADTSGCPLSSRRLMAFQRGLEDFAIMNTCQRRAPTLALRADARAAAQSDRWTGIPGSTGNTRPPFDAALASMTAACVGAARSSN